VQRAYHNRGIEFVTEGLDGEMLLPKELFDSASDNLLQNALRKRMLDQEIKVKAMFRCGEFVELEVCDSGAPVSAEVAKGLLRGPVPSESGFGIGLYQAAKLAEISGYSLQLAQNIPGAVCFVLRGARRRISHPAATGN
jgi:signal transduction histidine kinase